MSAWKLAVFKTDNSTCAYCGEKNTRNLEAHHWTPLNRLLKYHNIQTFDQAKQCPSLWDPENGITLCKTCHDIAHDKKTMRREKQYINTFALKYKAII